MCPPKRQTLTEPRSANLNGVRALVVEDTWHVANAMKRLLEGLGMAVVGPAATLAEAERLVTAQMPEVAVIDVNLKGETAYSLIEHLHEAGVPVLVVSGYAVLPGLTSETAAILQKPFDGTALVAALRRALNPDAGHGSR
jgi:DNA-binding response OmpR family regulator